MKKERSALFRDGTELAIPTGWPGLVNIRVVNEQQWNAVREVRTRSFVDRGMPVPDWVGEDTTCDACTRTFLLLHDEEAVGTVEITINATGGRIKSSSTLRQFGHELIDSTTRGEPFLDVSRLCVCQEGIIPDIRCFQAVFQNVTSEAEASNCELVITAVRKRQSRFYLMLGFRRMSEFRIRAGTPFGMALFVLDWPAVRSRLAHSESFASLFAPSARHQL